MNDKSDKPAPPAGGATPPSGPSDQNSKAKTPGLERPADNGDVRRQDAPATKREDLAFGTRRPDSAPIDPNKQAPVKPFGDKIASPTGQRPGPPAGKAAPAAGRPPGGTMAGPARATAQKAQSLEERLKAQPVESRRRPTTGPGNGNVPLTSTLESVRKRGGAGAPGTASSPPEGKTAPAAAMKSPPQPAAPKRARGPGRAAILGMLFVTAVVVVGAVYTSDLLREEPPGPQDGALEETAEPSTGGQQAGEPAVPATDEQASAHGGTSAAPSAEAVPDDRDAVAPSGSQDTAAPAQDALPPPPPPAPEDSGTATARDDVAAIPPPPASAESLTAAERLEMEQLLARLDMSPGTVDGVVDEDTQAAIRLYQEFAGLPVDGTASPALLDDLRDVARMVPDTN